MNNYFKKLTEIRGVLALVWSFATIYFIDYILKHFGNEKEILTLIIGLLSGSIIGGIFGTYFGGTHRKPTETITEENTNNDNNPK